MCGICYAKDFRGLPVSQRILQKYKNQRLRGTRGFGYYAPEIDQLYHNPDERPMLNRLKKLNVSELLFHHRFPTSTPNMRRGCHPYSTRANKDIFKHEYILVHNGVVIGSWGLKSEHERKGIKYVSTVDTPTSTGSSWEKFNDSEALLYDVALYLDGQQKEVKARGSIAFVAIEKINGKPAKLHFARNADSPLKMSYHKGKSLSLASEGGGDLIDVETLYTFNYKTEKITTKPLTLTTITAYTNPVAQPIGFDTKPNQSEAVGYYDAAGSFHSWAEDTASVNEEALIYLNELQAQGRTLAEQRKKIQTEIKRTNKELDALDTPYAGEVEWDTRTDQVLADLTMFETALEILDEDLEVVK